MSDEHNDIHAALDELGAPRGSTTAMRIRGLYNRIAEDAASTLAAVRAGLDTAIAERDEFIRQRDDAHHIALTALEREQAAGKRETEALDELNAAEQALTDSAITDGETLSDRIRELATRAAKYHGALVGANGERDETLRHLRETREVLHREREERATEKATLGAALQA